MSTEEPQKEDELSELLNLDIQEMGKLDLIEDEERAEARKKADAILKSAKPPGDKKIIQPGANQHGFQQMLNHPLTIHFEEQLKAIPEVKPGKKKLLDSLEQISVSDRSSIYKQSIQQQYDSAVTEARALYNALAKGQRLEYGRIKNIVNSFLKIFITDRFILLNLSTLDNNKEDYLFNHSVNVCLLTLNIATASGFDRKQVVEMGAAGLLADIGMMNISQSIRTKKGALSKEEMYDVWKHPMLGIQSLDRVSGLPMPVSYVAYQHHERQSGNGYPKQRRGRIIHAYSRIVAIADVYQALISTRSYRKPLMPHSAMVNIIKMGKKGMLNSHDVLNFTRFVSVFPVGSLVKLTSGCIAKVIEADPYHLDKPVVSVLTDSKIQLLSEEKIYQINLAVNSEENIEKPLSFNDFSQEIMLGF